MRALARHIVICLVCTNVQGHAIRCMQTDGEMDDVWCTSVRRFVRREKRFLHEEQKSGNSARLTLSRLDTVATQPTTLAKSNFTFRLPLVLSKQQRAQLGSRSVCSLCPSLLIHGLCCFHPVLSVAGACRARAKAEISMHKTGSVNRTPFAAPALSMKQFTPEQKHEILLEYSPRSTTHSLVALAQRHAVKGGRRTIGNWLARWDGTAASLQRQPVSGRPRSLTPEEVQRYVITPIRRKNRAHVPILYSELQPAVAEQTGKKVSARTIRRYGKEEGGGRLAHGKKRTAEERA